MRSRASGERSARPRLVWSTTPVALMTGASENAPRERSSAARSASASIPGAAPPVSRSRRRSAASTSRTVSVTRWRGIAESAGRPSSTIRSASTAGNARSEAACPRPAPRLPSGGKLRLHALLDARDHLVGLAAYGLHAGTARQALGEPSHRVLRQARPQLVEIPRREALPLEGRRPIARQLLDQSISLEGEPPGALDQLGQARWHWLLLHQATNGVAEVGFEASRRHALVDLVGLELPRRSSTVRLRPHLGVDLDLSEIVAVGLDEHGERHERLTLDTRVAEPPAV